MILSFIHKTSWKPNLLMHTTQLDDIGSKHTFQLKELLPYQVFGPIYYTILHELFSGERNSSIHEHQIRAFLLRLSIQY